MPGRKVRDNWENVGPLYDQINGFCYSSCKFALNSAINRTLSPLCRLQISMAWLTTKLSAFARAQMKKL